MAAYVIVSPPPTRGPSRPKLYWQCGRWVPVAEASTRYATFAEAEAVANIRNMPSRVIIETCDAPLVVHAADIGWGFLDKLEEKRAERQRTGAQP